MATDPPNKSFGVIAVDEEQLECVHHNGDELDLKRRQSYLTARSCGRLHDTVISWVIQQTHPPLSKDDC